MPERFDPGDIDVPGSTARIRLDAGAAGSADALIEGGVARLIPASTPDAADAVLSAEPDVWEEIAQDVRAGMAAYRAGTGTWFANAAFQ